MVAILDKDKGLLRVKDKIRSSGHPSEKTVGARTDRGQPASAVCSDIDCHRI